LIVGGAGFVGSQTAKLVAASGRTPVVFDNLSSGHRWALRWGAFEEGDLADRAAIDRVLARHQVEAVIDFAAHIEVGESVRNPRKYFRNNLVNTLNLLDAMVDQGIKDIVFSSTAAVYGDRLTVPIPEDHRLLPVNPYGESKLFVERTLRWYGEAYGLRWSALRYSPPPAPIPTVTSGEDHTREPLDPAGHQAALGQRAELQVFGTDYQTLDGTGGRDYVHVVDVGQAHPLALAHLAAGGELRRQRGTGRGHSVREVIAAVEREPAPSRAARSGVPATRRAVADARRPRAVWFSPATLTSPPSWSTHGNGTRRVR
jgi:UDP-glucose-4-epimerase GalE